MIGYLYGMVIQDDKGLFLREQYNALRREIDAALLSREKLMYFSVAGTLLAWSWVISQHPVGSWFLGLVLTALACLMHKRITAISRGVRRIGRFIAAYEKSLELPENLAWETHLRAKRLAQPEADHDEPPAHVLTWTRALVCVNALATAYCVIVASAGPAILAAAAPAKG